MSKAAWEKYYTHHKHLNVDELLLSSRGNCSFRMDIHNRPATYGNMSPKCRMTLVVISRANESELSEIMKDKNSRMNGTSASIFIKDTTLVKHPVCTKKK